MWESIKISKKLKLIISVKTRERTILLMDKTYSNIQYIFLNFIASWITELIQYY